MMVKCLEREKTQVVFGIPGAAICPFYDSLRESDIRHILARTEQNAGHMASGYARITGRAAVAVATSGPGATNLFTALATAYADSIPLVAITGQVPTWQLGHDAFQEVDTTGAAEPFTKYTYLVKEAKELPRVFREAFYLAQSGRKGPVLIDVPVDVQKQEAGSFSYPADAQIRGYKPVTKGNALQLKRLAAALQEAKKPLLCAGGGVFSGNAQHDLRLFCEGAGLPVVSTMMGLGVLPTEHPLFWGMVGQSGSGKANRAVQECDLLLLFGSRAGDRALAENLDQGRTVIHVDIDSAEIGKNLGTAIPLVGDCAAVARQLLTLEEPWPDWSDWKAQVWSWTCPKNSSVGTELERQAIRTIWETLSPDGIYVADVGENQLVSAQESLLREGGVFLTTGGLGTMGYSLPAALGAKLGAPNRQVTAVCGDGAFMMNLMELATARQHGIGVKLAVVRNDALGLVRNIQRDSYGGRYGAVALDGQPDLALLAQAFGLRYLRVDGATETKSTVQAFLASSEDCLLEVRLV